MRVREARACGLDASPPTSTTNISTTGFNGIASCLTDKRCTRACEKRVVKSESKETSKAAPLGDSQTLEASWKASDEYTARNKAGKEAQAKHTKAKGEKKKAALAP